MIDLKRLGAQAKGFLQPVAPQTREEQTRKFWEALSGYGKGLGEVGLNIAEVPLEVAKTGYSGLTGKPAPRAISQPLAGLEALRGKMRESVPQTPEAQIAEGVGRAVPSTALWLTGSKAIEKPAAEFVKQLPLGGLTKPAAWAAYKAAATPVIAPLIEEGTTGERVKGIPRQVASDLIISGILHEAGVGKKEFERLFEDLPSPGAPKGFMDVTANVGTSSEMNYPEYQDLIKRSYRKSGQEQRTMLKPVFEKVEQIANAPTEEGLRWLEWMRGGIPSRYKAEFDAVMELARNKVTEATGQAATSVPGAGKAGDLFAELGRKGIKGAERQRFLREAFVK